MLAHPRTGTQSQKNGPDFQSSQKHGKREDDFGKIRKACKSAEGPHSSEAGAYVVKAGGDGGEGGYEIESVGGNQNPGEEKYQNVNGKVNRNPHSGLLIHLFLNLTIKYGSQHEIYDTTCGDYLWDGRTYSASGDFPYTYTAANGCDSVVTLHLVYHELVTDARDGNTYCTMEYGDQVWMTENMRYLPQVDNTASVNDPKYYVYGYTGSNVLAAMNRPEYNNYGALYNFAAAQTACPTGWHLPTKDEWIEISLFHFF